MFQYNVCTWSHSKTASALSLALVLALGACSGDRASKQNARKELARAPSAEQFLKPPQADPYFVAQSSYGAPVTTISRTSVVAPSYSSADIGILVQRHLLEQEKTHKGWADTIDSFYAGYGYQPVWYRGGWSNEAYQAYEALANSWTDGLPTKRYLSNLSTDIYSASTPQEIAAVELALTQGMMVFLPELKYGLGQGSIKTTLLSEALEAPDFDAWLDTQRPQSYLYQGFRRAALALQLTDEQKRKLALNMHRARNADEQIHNHRRIRVNIPGFKLEALEGGVVTGEMRVIVGQPDRPTPELQDKIVDLKFSPDWHVPKVAAGVDLLPLLKRDARAIVEKMGLQAYRIGKYVDPSSVNWSKYSASNLPYTLRQKPGLGNALGGVRFSMTNPDAIFLHDTPEKDLFGVNLRSISSGCVRLEDARGLAAWILRDYPDWDMSKISDSMIAGKTRIKKLEKPVAVDMVYYTASIDRAGNLHFHRDIYEKDEILAAALGL